VNNEEIALNFQPRRNKINLDNKTRFSYPEGYCGRDYLRTCFAEVRRRASNSDDFKKYTIGALL
jgi:hypothetical protein